MTTDAAPRRPLRELMPILVGFTLAKLAIHLLTIRGYGWFRDEFYYIACSDHLAFGYVDHPPLSLVILRTVRELLGDSLVAVRLLPAFVGAALVLMVGLITWRLGGGRLASALAMLGALASPMFLGTYHIWSMNQFEPLVWAVAAYLIVRLCEEHFGTAAGAAGSSARLWMALGLLLGLGLQNKISVLWLGFGLAVGLLLTPLRRTLLTPWPWVAGAIALLIFSPYVAWQAQNDWATLEFMRNATQQKMSAVVWLDFVTSQLRMMSPAGALVWLAGLAFFLGAPAARPYRVLGWIYVAVFALLMLSGTARAGYLAPAYTWLFAGGGIAVERTTRALAARPLRVTIQAAVFAGVGVVGALFAPFGLPVLPVPTYITYAEKMGVAPSTAERKELAALPQWYADMHGWQSIVDTVAGVYAALPAEDRARARILGGNYGEAGAVDLLGRAHGLPAAISNHNSYWLWGPGDDDIEVLILLGASREGAERYFARVEEAAMIDCGHCMPYENNRPVLVARDLKVPLDRFWHEIKNYD